MNLNQKMLLHYCGQLHDKLKSIHCGHEKIKGRCEFYGGLGCRSVKKIVAAPPQLPAGSYFSGIYKFPVKTLLLHEICMCSLLNDFSVIHHQNLAATSTSASEAPVRPIRMFSLTVSSKR